MKKLIIVTLLFFCGIQFSLAQFCNPSNLNFYLTTQQEVDDFVNTYTSVSCSKIRGSIFLGSYATPNAITDISGLSFITDITKNLQISTLQNLTSLSGLDNLTNVGGLVVVNSDQLTAASFPNLASVASLSISGCNNLQSITLGNGTTDFYMPYGVVIQDNPLLNTINFNLVHVGSNVYNDFYTTPIYVGYEVLNNDSLTSLAFLGNISDPATRLIIIEGNAALTNLNSLQISSELMYLQLINNPNLTNLQGLENVVKLEYLLLQEMNLQILQV